MPPQLAGRRFRPVCGNLNAAQAPVTRVSTEPRPVSRLQFDSLVRGLGSLTWLDSATVQLAQEMLFGSGRPAPIEFRGEASVHAVKPQRSDATPGEHQQGNQTQ